MTERKMQGKGRIGAMVLGAVALGVSAFAVHWWTTARWQERTDNAYLRGDIALITPRVTAEVIEVAVTANQSVKKGEVLVRLDARDYAARLANAKANLAQAEAGLVANTQGRRVQDSLIAEARAQLSAATADRSKAQKDFERADKLVREGVATTARLDIATASLDAARAQVTRAEAGLRAAETQIGLLDAERAKLEAQGQSVQAALQLAELDFDATTLRAPVDGVIGDLNARVGERVTPGLRLLSLVSSGPLWVEANFKETQLTKVTPGQSVIVHIDAFPDADLTGTVQSLSPASGAEFALLPPDNATGNFTKIVQRVPVRVALELTPEWRARLRPGMSVEATIQTKPGV